MRKISFIQKVFISFFGGIILGFVCFRMDATEFVINYVKPFGTIFINLLKFTLVPMVLLSLTDGIVSSGNMRRLGVASGKTVVLFVATSVVAAFIGIFFATLFKNLGWFPDGIASGAQWNPSPKLSFMDNLVAIFPDNMHNAFATSSMMQVIVIAFLLGGSIIAAKEKGILAREVLRSFFSVVQKLIQFVISLSPIGIFAMMADVVATQGVEILGSLAIVILCAYVGYIVHIIVAFPIMTFLLAKISLWKYFKVASPALIFAFTTASSTATLPLSKDCSEKLGCEPGIASFVLSLGASMNLNGTSIYHAVAIVFLSSLSGADFSMAQIIMATLTAMIATMGAAGVSGTAVLMLAMVLEPLGIPLDLIMIIYGIDRLFDMGRTALNVGSNICISLVVSESMKPISTEPKFEPKC
ncbi:MAG: dicarboxylate/amino acid:cation symporter [Spirochaetaceae bacterium]|nr:dicarboxylate/amino acid:cation symporter [Spirochaetaceae bacterium]